MFKDDKPVGHGEIKEWVSWGIKAFTLGIAAFSVSYLSEISKHLTSLDIQIVQMGVEMKSGSGFQNTINNSIARDLERISNRLDYVEKHCCSK